MGMVRITPPPPSLSCEVKGHLHFLLPSLCSFSTVIKPPEAQRNCGLPCIFYLAFEDIVINVETVTQQVSLWFAVCQFFNKSVHGCIIHFLLTTVFGMVNIWTLQLVPEASV